MAVSIDSLMIVEDDPRLQSRLKESLLDSGLAADIIACSTLASAKELLVSRRPDVVLLDIGLPDGSGLDLLVFQRELKQQARMIILSGFSDEQTIVSAIQLGAQGYLLKQDSSADIIGAIRDILQGIPPLSPSVAQCMMLHIRSELPDVVAPDPSVTPLPPRLHHTLTLLARGLTYHDIAGQMQITFHTVASYSQEIYNKLAVHSRAEAVFKARQLKLLK
jgi:DNA-binding NarL/FixJ family response regulator